MNPQAPQMQVLHNQWEQGREESPLRDYWVVFKRRWWLVLLVFAVVVGSTVVYLVRTPRQYEATAVVKIPTSGGGGGLAAALGNFLPVGPSSDVATEIEVIKGTDIAKKVIRGLGLDKKEENLERDWRLIVSGFRETLKVGQKGQTNLIEITATGDSPQEAKDIANEVVDKYIQLSETSNQKVWHYLISQMEAKLNETEAALERSRQLLHNYEAKEGITTAFGPLLMGAGATTGGTQYVVSESPQAVAQLKAGIMEMEVRLEGLRKSFPDADPKIISLKNQIAVSTEKLQQEEKKAIEKYNKQFGLTRIAAEVVFNQQLYSSLVSKHEELKAQYITQNKSPEVIEKAVEPIYPSKPKRRIIFMLSAVLGVFFGLGIALLREYMDNSVHTTDDVARFIDVPVLGSLPRLRGVKKNPGSDALITYYDANSSGNKRDREFYKESYRMLQLQILVATDGKLGSIASVQNQASSTQHQGALTLLVTSSTPEEGKSTVATNLAISMSQTGKRVLLVDADCRDPVQHKLLDLDSHMGLMDVLAGSVAWDDVVNSTAIDNLYVITSGVERAASLSDGENGKRDPSALLISSRLEAFTELSKKQFDVIIFDSPSASLASESAAIGSKVDGVVLVVKANDTRKNIILQAKQRVQNSGGKILGTVLNCA